MAELVIVDPDTALTVGVVVVQVVEFMPGRAKLGLADPDAVRTPGYQVVGVTGHNAVGVGKF